MVAYTLLPLNGELKMRNPILNADWMPGYQTQFLNRLPESLSGVKNNIPFSSYCFLCFLCWRRGDMQLALVRVQPPNSFPVGMTLCIGIIVIIAVLACIDHHHQCRLWLMAGFRFLWIGFGLLTMQLPVRTPANYCIMRCWHVLVVCVVYFATNRC